MAVERQHFGDLVDLEACDRAGRALVGGKAAHLGALSRIPGVRVPPGLCITTDAWRRLAGGADLEPLAQALAARIDPQVAYAVRSSATAEDAPGASFAGQHVSTLDVIGVPAIVEAVRACWASLNSAEAVAYRRQNAIPDAQMAMAVVIQEMVAPRAAGVLFTADPVSGDRTICAVEAVAGLGDALASGRAAGDAWAVRAGAIVRRAVVGDRPVLSDAEVGDLVALGRRIEAAFGAPQDIEWCLAADGIHVVQSRPITTLFPIPAAPDAAPRVYLSVGHQQMMTDAMPPLGWSIFALTALRPMVEAGSRLFVDVTAALAAPAARAGLLAMLGRTDPHLQAALQVLVERDFVPSAPTDGPPAPVGGLPIAIAVEPAVVATLIARDQAAIAALERALDGLAGEALLDCIEADVAQLKAHLLDPRSQQAVMAGIQASWWLDETLAAWLGVTNAADALTRAAPGNITAQMGRALLDVADVIRAHPAVIAHLKQAESDAAADAALETLAEVEGGPAVRAALDGWLEIHGARCPGEIDLTRPRWRERPAQLLPVLLGHVEHLPAGAGRQQAEAGRAAARAAEVAILAQVRALPDGAQRAAEVKRMIDRLRAFIGYREYPKYGIVRRYALYRQALLAEAARLVAAGVLRAVDDLYAFEFGELRGLVRTGRCDRARLAARMAAFRAHQRLTPPRVLTSDGEAIRAGARAHVAGALTGLGVSAGVVEGRARVVLDLADATLRPGDILVTRYTDPSWTPAFVAVAGLVTEVGGQMTHGSVIAREYGLPAVVGVLDATRRIANGEWIRVDGASGLIERVPAPGDETSFAPPPAPR